MLPQKEKFEKIKKRKSRKDRKGVTGISDPPKQEIEQEIDEDDDVVDPPEQEIDEDDDVVDPPEQEIDEDEDDDVVDPPKQGINEFDDVVDLCEDENLICGNKVGKLFVSDKKIADGSKGYVVHEGTYDEHRPAAVKVFDLSHCKNDETESETKNEMDITNDVIQFDNEMDILYDTDSHPNIIRLYGFERLKDYAYLCIERWKYTLEAIPFGSTEEAMWNEVGVPSPLMISLIRNIVSGLQHLHSLKIIHRNLTPSNVVITCNLETLVAKLSDMRISKRLTDGLDHHATSFSYPGWQAPEQIRKKNETYATDMFQLGCVIFYAFTGYHPFGRVKDRKNNILTNNRIKFSQVKHPEAFHLIDILLNPIWNLRPTSSEVLHHPMFWSSLKRLFFLRDASDRVEAFDKKVWDKLSRRKNQVQGLRGWNNKFDKDLVDHIERLGHRQYDYKSLRHLLRFIRNQINHYWEHPVDIQGLVGTYPEGLDKYFTVRFPELFIVVYKFIFEEFMEEDAFKTYFKESTI